jgi:hypothetical protein
MTDQEYNEAAFEREYLRYKRRDRTDEPPPENFRISPVRAEEIMRRLHREFEQKVVDRTLNRGAQHENAS